MLRRTPYPRRRRRRRGIKSPRCRAIPMLRTIISVVRAGKKLVPFIVMLLIGRIAGVLPVRRGRMPLPWVCYALAEGPMSLLRPLPGMRKGTRTPAWPWTRRQPRNTYPHTVVHPLTGWNLPLHRIVSRRLTISYSLSSHCSRLGRRTVDNLLGNYHASVARAVLGDAFMWEVRAKERDQSAGYGRAERVADCACAGVGHPVAWTSISLLESLDSARESISRIGQAYPVP